MDVLDEACKIQMMAGNQSHLILPNEAICELTYQQLCSDGDDEGLIEWPAYLRLLNNT